MGERQSGFTEAEHHRRLRTDPLYCLRLQMDELAMQQEPSLASLNRGAPEVPQEKPREVTRIHTYINIDNKALELQKRIVSLEEEIKRMRGGAKGRGGEEYVIK